MTTKLPPIPKPPADLSPEAKRYLEALSEAVEVRLGRRGDPQDRAVTLRELVDSGVAQKIKAAAYDPNSVTQSNIGFQPTATAMYDASTPPQVTTLTATGLFEEILLSWGFPTYDNHSASLVYVSTDSDFDNAVLDGQTVGSTYIDKVGSSATTRYYWVQHVSKDGVIGPLDGPANATTQNDVGYLVDALSDQTGAPFSEVETAYDITVNGATVTIPAGTYINTAFIKTASIASAHIGALDATKITSGEIDADRIGTGTLEANKILLDNSTITSETIVGGVNNGKVALKVGAISAGAITSGTLDVSQLAAIENLEVGNIEGDVNKFTPFKGTFMHLDDVDYLPGEALNTGGGASGETTVWEGSFAADTIKPKKPFITATGYALFKDSRVWQIQLHMKLVRSQDVYPTSSTFYTVDSGATYQTGGGSGGYSWSAYVYRFKITDIDSSHFDFGAEIRLGWHAQWNNTDTYTKVTGESYYVLHNNKGYLLHNTNTNIEPGTPAAQGYWSVRDAIENQTTLATVAGVDYASNGYYYIRLNPIYEDSGNDVFVKGDQIRIIQPPSTYEKVASVYVNPHQTLRPEHFTIQGGIQAATSLEVDCKIVIKQMADSTDSWRYSAGDSFTDADIKIYGLEGVMMALS